MARTRPALTLTDITLWNLLDLPDRDGRDAPMPNGLLILLLRAAFQRIEDANRRLHSGDLL